jgi:hypothetical protein
MDKKIIKDHLTKRFLTEEVTPGINMANKIKKDNAKVNNKGVKDEAKDSLDYNKSLKQDKDTSKMAPNKYNYDDKFEKTYHDEIEIMNGQEMIQYDSKPDSRFTERALDAIEGSAKMGNQGGIGNAQATWGASSDDFGKNLVKRIKASTEKRSKQTPTLNLRGRDIQADLKDTGHRPYAIEEAESGLGKWVPPSEEKKQHISNFVNNTGDEKETEFRKTLKTKNDNIDKYLKSLEDKKSAEDGINPNKENNNNPQIKESMKRLKFKSEFNGLGNALKLIPEGYKVANKTFEMTDGNETYRIRWEGNLSEGKAVVLTASDKKMVNEDIKRMKELFGYKSQDTLGLVKGNARINENKVFGDIWNKSKELLSEEDIESTNAKESNWEETSKKAPEATKHVQGKTSSDKGMSAPKAKEGDASKAVSQAPESKKHMANGSAKATDNAKQRNWDEVSGGEKMIETETSTPKQGHWEDNVKSQAAEAKKHVHLKENMTDEEIMEEEDLMKEIEEDMKNMGINEIGDGSNYAPGTENDPNSPWNQKDEEDEEDDDDDYDDDEIEENEEESDEEGEGEEEDTWNKPEAEDDSSDEKEPTAADIKKTGIPIGADDNDEEDDIATPIMAKSNVKLLQSPSTGEYWIDNNGVKSKVPDMYMNIASDKSKKGAQKASIILKKMQADAEHDDDSFEKNDFGLDEYAESHYDPKTGETLHTTQSMKK